jgi:hypothetical protein
VSKRHKALHRNPRTKQWLENREQVCPSCFENFGTTEAGDAHRIGIPGMDRRCLTPEIAKLIATTNKFGTTIWRINNGTTS